MINKLSIWWLFLLACSCSKEEPSFEKKDKDGIVVDKSPVWYKRTSDEGTHGSLASTYTTYDGGYLAIQKEKGKDYLIMLDAYTGKTRWHWNDLLPLDDGYLGDIDISFPFQKSNLLTFNTGSRAYSIDLENGTTKWKIRRDRSYNTYLNYNENNFILRDGPSMIGGSAYIGNIQTGEIVKLLTPPYSQDNPYLNANLGKGGVDFVKHFQLENIDYYFVVYSEPNNSQGKYDAVTFIGLFDKSNEIWKYSGMVIDSINSPGGGLYIDQIVDNRVVVSIGRKILCIDIMTGKQLWEFKTSKGDFLFGGHIVRYGRVYALAEGEAMYCLDVNAGYKIWSAHRPGTSSRMLEMNGVIYWRNGGDGLLYAVDAFTGKAYWKLESPDEKCCGQGFKRELAVLPAQNGKKPMVLTSTWIGAVGYEAVK